MRLRQRDIDDPITHLTNKMMMRIEVAVVAHRTIAAGHNLDRSLFHQNLEISIDRGQRQARKFPEHSRVNLPCSGVDLGGSEPGKHLLPLTRAMTPTRILVV